MKIGVFDSGLGGLFVMRALVRKLPRYDYVYLGDTQRVPYGNRSPETVYRFLEEAVRYLFKKDCGLIIVACNTASAEALRKIQRNYLPKHYPKRRVLGVIIPTVEEALKDKKIEKIGVLATQGTVNSGAYIRELKKLNRGVKVFQNAAPMLVPLIESGEFKRAEPFVREYLKPLKRKKVQKIILGCTHYPALKNMIRRIAGVPVVSQDEIIPRKLKDYLSHHPEIDSLLSENWKRELLVTDITPEYVRFSRKWFGKTKLKTVEL
ncbi:MAG: glutamate racemase [Patescibacteria group bacterium]|nr:glutamate racemase [Patescibacteria group bacterium]MDE2014973.1 glutamate racemase [Patescibacteria group bacterium]MDE2226402.1 glutamate racemase [Patescibacteria group bacterium]